jgi:hypothetical protein
MRYLRLQAFQLRDQAEAVGNALPRRRPPRKGERQRDLWDVAAEPAVAGGRQ